MSNNEMDQNETNTPSRAKRPALIGLIVLGLGIVFCVAFYLYIWPNIVGPRQRTISQRNACINNLRLIDGAKQQWALENNMTETNTVVSWDNIKDYLIHGLDGQFYCPKDSARTADSSYEIGDLKTLPKCKIDGSHQIN